MIDNIITSIDNFVWGPILVYLSLIVGLFFSIAMKFPQFRFFKKMIRYATKGSNSDTGISGFQSLAVAVGGRVGTGNITGTASAIFFGGPGSIFWMWMMAIVCSVSAYTESSLAQIWKQKSGKDYAGGPSFYMEKGLKSKALGIFYATFSIGFLIIFTGLQSNAFTTVSAVSFNIPTTIVAFIYALLIGLVIFGGVKRISTVAEKIVPFMSILYILAAIITLFVNIKEVPALFGLIIGSALNLNAFFGGLVGTAITWGVKRGLFSNEAGLGTGAWVAGCADVSHPAKAGFVQMLSTFIDTLLICTTTALMILSSGAYNVVLPDGSFLVSNVPGVDSSQFAAVALDSIVPGIGGVFIILAMFFFTFSTIMAYSVYLNGINSYLFKGNIDGERVKKLMVYVNIGTVAMGFLGPLISSNTIWSLASAMCGILSLVNIVSLVLLCKPAIAVLKDYERQSKKGIDPVFIPENVGIKDAELWHDIIENDYSKELDAYKKTFPNESISNYIL